MALRQQRWSPLNVPLMWSAAGSQESGVVVEWLITSCAEITEPVEFHGGQVTCGKAAHVGWTALREVFRTWNVHETGDLTFWLRSNGFAAVQPGNHIYARAQERILTQSVRCSHAALWSTDVRDPSTSRASMPGTFTTPS